MIKFHYYMWCRNRVIKKINKTPVPNYKKILKLSMQLDYLNAKLHIGGII